MKNNLAGQRFGKLVAIEPTQQRKNGYVIWRCQCDCGNMVDAPSRQLLQGCRRSCGCLSHPPLKDWVGKQFGKLTVLSYEGKTNGKHIWRCRCSCGNETLVAQSNLKSGHTTSCGCNSSGNLTETLHFVDGTCLETIRSKKICSSNTSGIRGVYKHSSSQNWCAQITFKGKTIYLGSYPSVEAASAARKKAEERLFGECLDQYADLLQKKDLSSE